MQNFCSIKRSQNLKETEEICLFVQHTFFWDFYVLLNSNDAKWIDGTKKLSFSDKLEQFITEGLHINLRCAVFS